MKTVRLKELNLKNFKGVGAFQLMLNGSNMAVYGDNATGKTTLYDAFTWLLFGKDSLNRADFEIKPINGNGNAHGIETEVEGHILIDGQSLALRRVFYEKWTKKRGSAQKEFTGHTTDFFIDGVPAKEKEYLSAVADICDETLFKLLTNPRHFNEVLKWQDRRKMLLEVCGDITDADVIASAPSLSELPGILGKRSLDDHKKVVAARRTEINKELDKIPVRIDEVKASEVKGLRDEKTIRSVLAVVNGSLKEKQAELNQIQNGGELAQATKQLNEIEAKIIAHDNKKAAESRKTDNERWDRQRGLEREAENIKDQIDKITESQNARHKAVANFEQAIKDLEAETVSLKNKWYEVDAQIFLFEQSCTCPTCGQSLPEDQLTAAREKAEADFNEKKAHELELINSTGKARKADISTALKGIEELNAKTADDNEKIVELRTKLSKIQTDIDAIKPAPANVPEKDREREKLVASLDGCKARIAALKSGAEGSAESVKSEISKLTAEAEDLNKQLLQIEANRRIEARIDELSKQERSLAKEFEKLERELHLCEMFIRAKVSMLTDKINSKFKTVNFRLFAEQINGGLQEVCETMVSGVPYNSLNNAARIQAGIEISNVLQAHHGISMTIWVDNRESIVSLPEVDCQVISLVVSASDKTLRIQEGA